MVHHKYMKRHTNSKMTIMLLFMLLTMLFSVILPILFANRTLAGF